MTRYKMPEALGGGEYEAATVHGDDVGFDLPGVRDRLWLYTGNLTEVKPPLPPEPPVGSVVCILFSDGTQRVFQRTMNDESGWRDFDTWGSWSWLCSLGLGAPVLLVPDPLAEAPELPWRDGDHGLDVSLEIGCGCNGQEDGAQLVRLQLGSDTVALAPPVARRAGLALLRAAMESES